MRSRRELARRLDALLTGTDSSVTAELDDRWAVLADAPLVKRIREELVDETTVMPTAAFELVTAFLSYAELSVREEVTMKRQPIRYETLEDKDGENCVF